MNTKKIKALLDAADRLEADAEEKRWLAAEAIAEQLTSGMTQRDLANEIGRSQAFVRTYAKVWVEYSCIQDRRGQTFGALVGIAGSSLDRRESILEEAQRTGRSATTVRDRQWRERISETPAQREESRQQQRASNERAAEALGLPDLPRDLEFAKTLSRLGAARFQISKALEELEGFSPLRDDERDDVARRTKMIAHVLGWLESFAVSGERSFDEQLQAILEAGE